MRKKSIAVVCIAAILVLTSCNKSNLIDNKININSSNTGKQQMSESEKFYSCQIVDKNISPKSVIGFNNDKIYNAVWSNDSNLGFACCDSPGDRRSFPDGLSNIISAGVYNNKMYINMLGEDGASQIVTVDSNFTTYNSQLACNNYIIDFSVSPDNNIYTFNVSNETQSYEIHRFHDGVSECCVSLSDLTNSDQNAYVCDIKVFSDVVYLTVNTNDKSYILVLDNNLNCIKKIENEEFISLSHITNAGDDVLLYTADIDTDNNCIVIYSIDANTYQVNNVDIISQASCVYSGNSVYDFFYCTEKEIFGYKADDCSSTYIADKNDDLSDIFTIDDTIHFLLSDSVFSEQISAYTLSADDIIPVYNYQGNSSISGEEILPSGVLQLVEAQKNDSDYTLHIVNTEDLSSGEVCIVPQQSYDLLKVLYIDNDNVLVQMYNQDTNDEKICSYDMNGKFLFEYSIDPAASIGKIILSENNCAYVNYWTDKGSYFSLINAQDHSICDEKIKCPDNFLNSFNGKGRYDLFYSTDSGIYGVEYENSKITEILNLNQCDLPEEAVIHDFYYQDENTMYISTDEAIYKLVPSGDTPKVSDGISIGCISDNVDPELIKKFKKENPSCDVNIVRYYENTDEDDISKKIDMDLLSDKCPDILTFYNQDYYSPARHNNKNAYADLYELMENDAELTRDMLLPNILEALEDNHSLYQITPSFTVDTILGKPDVLNEYSKWDTDSYVDFINNHPDNAFEINDQTNFSNGGWHFNSFINYEDATCTFESDSFKALFDCMLNTPESAEAAENYYLKYYQINDFNNLNILEDTDFGGEKVVNIGYPDIPGNGALIDTGEQYSILKQSKNIDYAWKFIKLLFSDENQSRYYKYNFTGFPMRKDLIENMKQKTKTVSQDDTYGAIMSIGDKTGRNIDVGIPDEEQISKISDIIEEAVCLKNADNSVNSIITEEYVNTLLEGSSSDEAIRNIQNRVQIYLNEQY
ncbi:MAG: extracellular solute-binding protein [Oscillospiraceae bacterium]|nr:extracellular solute-binding protein [Oscillospiraceae bacterium]